MTLPPRVAPLRMADLFSGTRSVSNVFKARGWEVETVDLIDGQDVRDWQPRGHYDLVWASPPCQLFSVAGHFKHFTNGRPRDDIGKVALSLVKDAYTLAGLADAKFTVFENPRGLLRKVWRTPDYTTWWCQWGDERAKPTDLWGNLPASMLPLPICHNGTTDHARAPRGAKTGTQGRKGALERSRIPVKFTTRLAECIEAEVGV